MSGHTSVMSGVVGDGRIPHIGGSGHRHISVSVKLILGNIRKIIAVGALKKCVGPISGCARVILNFGELEQFISVD